MMVSSNVKEFQYSSSVTVQEYPKQAQTNLKMSISSCDFKRDQIKATKRNISFHDSQTLISPFWTKYASVVATGG